MEALNPLRVGLEAERVAPPCVVVIFGASGDLTRRKLVPALFGLGAIQLAKEPRGIVVMNVEQFRRLRRRLSSRQRAPEPATAA